MTLRRGPASIKIHILPTLTRASASSRVTTLRSKSISSTRSQALPLPRAFQTYSRWQRHAAAAAVEEEIVQEGNASRPPPGPQINAQVKNGPVTKFKELSERGLVCQTVVDTLTARMQLETMTQVQSMTINETLKGIDVYAK